MSYPYEKAIHGLNICKNMLRVSDDVYGQLNSNFQYTNVHTLNCMFFHHIYEVIWVNI